MSLRFVVVLLLTLPLSAARAQEAIRFSRDILPILSDNCFQCHGPDDKGRQGDLRLDREDAALRTDKPVIVPGQSAASELMKRLLSTDPDEVMPPPKSGHKMTPPQIELVRRWIDGGAQWGKHWAFEKLARPAVPMLKTGPQPANPIDGFIRAKLEQMGAAPSAEASRETLIRRVTLDLTGLPPTIEEVDTFLADQSPDAYDKLVDRLLLSPRFGERMVWEWLDAARYADTNGYQGDPTRSMFYWRDWVIEALNNNMPFDQFTIEQLAGDLLPNPSQSQLIATGFHRNHMINGEGGRIAEESRVDYVQDRVETTATVWMGLTFNCCRCHNHKFDPVTQREYYQLAAYFNSIDESGANDAGGLANPVISLALPEQQKQLDDMKAAETLAAKERDELEKTVRAKQAEWEQQTLKSLNTPASDAWTTLAFDDRKSEGGAMLAVQNDGSLLASGPNPARDTFILSGRMKLKQLVGLRLEALPDDSFVNRGPGRADNGNFVLSEIKLTVNDKPVELAAVKADFEQGPGLTLASSLDNNRDTGWAVAGQFGVVHTAVLEVKPPLSLTEPDAAIKVQLEFQSPHVSHVLGRFRLSVTDSMSALQPLPTAVRDALLVEEAKRSDAQKKELSDYYLNADASLRAARQKAETAKNARQNLERAQPRTMVMRERAQPRDTFILIRGAYDKYGDKVTQGVPAVLPAMASDAAPNRLSLARWLVSGEHPLTARVTVNRYWQSLFGMGIVKTAEDFGVQSERPSHPELLDWLASEFQSPTVPQPSVKNSQANNAWNMKHILRLIVTSATYKQSSAIRDHKTAADDPDNRWLSRGPRYRLPSWMIRDQALAVSGLLVEKLGGPPVKGYQPAGVWEEATFGFIRYQQDSGNSLYRRSLYQFWRRIVGPTLFFDTATRQTCTVRLARTNTPLQALVTLNDVTYVEAARALAQRVLTSKATSTDERITLLYRLTLSRPPQPKERAVLSGAIERLQTRFTTDPESARKLLTVGESKRDEKLNVPEHAAWTSLCSALLNLDEFLSHE